MGCTGGTLVPTSLTDTDTEALLYFKYSTSHEADSHSYSQRELHREHTHIKAP